MNMFHVEHFWTPNPFTLHFSAFSTQPRSRFWDLNAVSLVGQAWYAGFQLSMQTCYMSN
jgi:hypothetical protein